MSSIGEICRSIVRQRCTEKVLPTNPIYSPYSLHHLCLPVQSCDEPSWSTNLYGLNERPRAGDCAPMKFTTRGHCQSIVSEQCIQNMSQAILDQVHCHIPEEELALLCYSLPSLIRDIMCKSPWLTPNDIIQWMTEDIRREARKCFRQDQNSSWSPSKISSRSHPTQQRSVPQRNSQESIVSHRSDSSHSQSKSPRDQTSSTSISPNRSNSKKRKEKQRNKEKGFRSPSTSSFNENDDEERQSSQRSFTSKEEHETDDNNTDRQSFPNSPTSSREESNVDLSPSVPKTDRFRFPGKIDPQASEQVQKCLDFYQQMREHFDENVAAMLLKCCLCYGNCSGKN